MAKYHPGQLNGSTGGNGGGSTSTSESFKYFYHPDHLGSSSYITDASGEVYQHLEYFAFGETFVEEHSNTDRTPYLYNGKELDEETGLYYYGARYYDARISVWLGVDPHSDKYPNMTPFAYVANNPILFVDPNGKDNIIYLLVTPGLSSPAAQQIADQANVYLKGLGLETRVILYDAEINGEFNASNLDKTDNWAVIGTNRKEIVKAADKINPEWISGYLEDGTKPWSGNDNPETSNPNRLGDGLGILIDYENNTSKQTNNKIVRMKDQRWQLSMAQVTALIKL